MQNLKFTIIGLTLMVVGCASPAVNMTPEQISMLSDNQLCQLQSSYGWEAKTETEIGRRQLNCDPAYRTCIAQGYTPNTPEANGCAVQMRENWALQEKIKQQEAELKEQQRQQEIDKQLNDALFWTTINNRR